MGYTPRLTTSAKNMGETNGLAYSALPSVRNQKVFKIKHHNLNKLKFLLLMKWNINKAICLH